MIKVGIIGGSGLDDPKLLSEYEEKDVKTPYGDPSSSLSCGKLNGVEVVIIARHGKKHTITPTNVNNRANIFALKNQGCTHIIATTACGSLREEIGRGDFVIIDQFIDFTRHRKITFFEDFKEGVKHTPMAEPFDKNLRRALIETSINLGFRTHTKGTVVTIEGPRFSTRAESQMFRKLGADVINMSTAPEAILSKEIGIPYAAIAMSTDYDCWKKDETPVSWEEIIKVFNTNVEKVKKLIIEALPRIKLICENNNTSLN
ncbi:MAG: S-methyl-5'-thioadenosine phosphorylase [Candidatus Woesearchaeota archaeon]